MGQRQVESELFVFVKLPCLLVDALTFPVLIYDPRKGDKIAQRLSLQGNPSEKTDFFIEPKTNEVYDFIRFARTLPRGINILEMFRRARPLEVTRLPERFSRIIPQGEVASRNTSTKTATRAKR